MNNFNNNYGYPQNPGYMNQYQQPYGFRNQLKQYADVNGLDGAKAYQLMPNQSILLMDYENPVIYKKVTDQNGNSSLRYFKLEEITEDDIRAMSQNNQSQVSSNNYASKEDIDNINKKLDELFKKLDKQSKKDLKDTNNA